MARTSFAKSQHIGTFFIVAGIGKCYTFLLPEIRLIGTFYVVVGIGKYNFLLPEIRLLSQICMSSFSDCFYGSVDKMKPTLEGDQGLTIQTISDLNI